MVHSRRKYLKDVIKNMIYVVDLKDVTDASILLNFFEVEDEIPVYWPVRVIKTPKSMIWSRMRNVELCGLKLTTSVCIDKMGRKLTRTEQHTIQVVESVAQYTSLDGIVDTITMILDQDYRQFFSTSSFSNRVESAIIG